jgi:hypothetical protein
VASDRAIAATAIEQMNASQGFICTVALCGRGRTLD